MEFLQMLVYEKTFRVIAFCLYIILCGNVDNCISAGLKFQVLYNDIKVNESLSIVNVTYTVSVEEYYTADEYKSIVCDIVKDVNRNGDEIIGIRVGFYYVYNSWTLVEELLPWGHSNQISVAFYNKTSYPDSAEFSSLSIYRDKNGNRLDENIVLSFDHICDCKK